ncbi:Integrator complex subunit 13 [Holothuria leucospilota]|uniref:Integrator complex subunit 13 n=1 Tax=Holothuria leucospilota TaxID=206669 RepID=A0A9Q1CLY3_HOLLE|nr:Integrator complex subunit 13 [Holothuria leucospilota]
MTCAVHVCFTLALVTRDRRNDFRQAFHFNNWIGNDYFARNLQLLFLQAVWSGVSKVTAFLKMAQSFSHKTVFVLDHSHCFSKPSGIVVDYDLSSKNRTPGFIPLHPLNKTLWTWSVECILEYCRMVYDIFPTGKHICLIASDEAAIVLNSWMQTDQSVPVFMEALARLGAPRQNSKGKSDIMFGLTEAITALTRCTEEQHQARTSLDATPDKVINRGRIVCITSLKSSSEANQIIRKFKEALIEENKIAAASDELMPVNECELEIIDLHPLSTQPALTSLMVQAFQGLTCEVGSYKVGKTLASKLLTLVQRHFDLAVTTITGIPMKEEQNAGSSANYDVGILHSKRAHDEILCLLKMTGSSDSSGASGGSSAGPTTSSGSSDKIHAVVLKWCQPRLSISDLLHSTASFRISAIDVNSRPSLCLTNFLLNGRQVILEQPRRTGAKVVTHMLASHGGEIFIHCLGMNRSPLEDPPSISEGPGGRVTDYRIKDFGEFMKRNRLAPCQEMLENEDDVLPIERAKSQLERMTRNYPMIISETVLYNLRNCIDPLLDIIYKPTLDEEDKTECRNVIYGVVKMEANNEPLPVPTIGTVRKGNKREEQYRQMWSELESLIRSAADLSPDHEEILDCVLNCRKPGVGDSARRDRQMTVKTEPQDVDQPTKRTNESSNSDPSGAADMFSPESPPPCKKPNLDFTGTFGKPTGGGQSLLSLWTNRLKTIHSRRHEEFAGRAESFGAIATLYPNLNVEKSNGNENNGNPIPGKAS